ncbi:Glu-tRNA(Gln) amidotransferase subunit GatD [Candidatus Woesearchaeota archaeon]|nr:Glu-tRNA(Gln) amidotransferase subunit GatD [Candidatus Woesearchaeota archaeon]
MVKEGNYVVIKTKNEELKGLLLKSQNPEKFVIKLTSGYNFSINKKDVVKLDIIKPEKEEKEFKKPEIQKNPKLKKVLILHTGGTIASKVDYKTGAVSPSFSNEDMLKMFPEIKDIVNIDSKFFGNIFSEDINFNHYNLLAKEIKNNLNYDGIIITHGTDTMHYTSAALSFILEDLVIPIILVGAQRSSDRGSSDSFQNLFSACQFISKSDFSGVAICMHENMNDDSCLILPGLRTRKLHTSRRDAFKAINVKPIAKVKDNSIEILNHDYPKRDRKDKNNLNLKLFEDPKIGILKTHPNMKKEEISMYSKFDGLIIEGTGLGHMPINKVDKLTLENELIFKELEKLSKKIPVVITSQCIFGRVNLNVYSTGRKLQEIGILGNLSDMTTETAFIKLAWLISNYPKDVRKMIDKDLKGEISRRTSEDFI